MRTYSETEERILNAALVVFAGKGKGGARTQEIADRAGINKAMLHYYFRSKDGLYEAVFAYVLGRFLSVFARSVATEPEFRGMLRGFIDTYVDFVAQNPDFARLLLNELLAGGPVLRLRLRELLSSSTVTPPAIFITSMQRGQEAGSVRAVDPVQTLITVISSCVFFFVASPILDEAFPRLLEDREAFLVARKNHIFDVLYYGLSNDRASSPEQTDSQREATPPTGSGSEE